MKVAIMQPYLFPYIGYFQLIKEVDLYVIGADVQYIKGGWINRNRILVNKTDHLFTFSLKKDSTYLNINQRYFSDQFEKDRSAFLRKLKQGYGKSERFNEVSNLVEEILNVNTVDQDISKIITRSLKMICSYLDINTPIVFASEVGENINLKGEERIIDLCKRLEATHYINPIGGVELYSKENFLKHNIELNFLKAKLIPYKQQSTAFIPWLSIIDVLMSNSKEDVKIFLDEYELL